MENYIEINSDTVVYFPDWIYDAILNRTIKTLNDEDMIEYKEFFEFSGREQDGFLSMVILTADKYQQIYRLFKNSFNKAEIRKSGLFLKKTHKEFISNFGYLLDLMLKDQRFYEGR